MTISIGDHLLVKRDGKVGEATNMMGHEFEVLDIVRTSNDGTQVITIKEIK